MADHMDMAPKMLPSCWFCQKRVKFGTLIAVNDGVITDRNEIPEGYYPIVWRYAHSYCVDDKASHSILADTLPLVYVAWLRLTIRLLDQKGAWYLFEMTNWRYVLDCVQDDYIEGLNEYRNPPLKRAKAKVVRLPDPDTILPDGRKKKLVRPAARTPLVRKKLIRR